MASDLGYGVPSELDKLVERRFEQSLDVAVRAEVRSVVAGPRRPNPIRLDALSAQQSHKGFNQAIRVSIWS